MNANEEPGSFLKSSALAGELLGRYEVKGLLGAGGMGEVYRGWDSRLKREIAIKALPEESSGDDDRVARFRREAEVLGSLNHPHIAAIYDAGELGELRFLVLELVEGDTLADRIARGPIPVPEALRIAGQIADALEAAHEKGVVHRDLKPGNIKIGGDGAVKVLDFGLAKLVTGVGSAEDSQTMSMAATQAGMVLGTPAYMAPEQARGQAVDKRADIWAFGAVLYEMLTGRRAFEGNDVSTILAAVIQSEPRWDDVPENTRRLLGACLQKDPKKRLRDVGDAWKLLDSDASAIPKKRTARSGWIAAAVLAVVAVVALWAPWRSAAPQSAQPIVRLEVDLGQDVSLLPLFAPTFSSIIISPDGSRLVYVAGVAGGPQRLLTRRLDQAKAVELPGTQGAMNPFFSPNGQWVAFWNGKGLAKVSVEGGPVTSLAELGNMSGGSWADDDSIIVGSGIPLATGLLRVASDGGTPSVVLNLAAGELFHSFPHALPGTKAALMMVAGDPPNIANARIDIVSLADGRRKTLVRGAGSPRYMPSGHLLYVNKTTMFAIPFDLDTWETRGTAVAILDDVAYDSSPAEGAQFDVSRDGTLVYRKAAVGAAPAMMRVQTLDATGKQTPLISKPGTYQGTPRVSPDGWRVAITIRDGTSQDIWVHDLQRDTMTRLTAGGALFASPLWSKDGRYVLFSAFGGGGIFWIRADGTGRPQQLLPGNTLQFPVSFSADGKRLAYTQIDGIPQIWFVEVEEKEGMLKAGKPERFLTTHFSDSDPVFSPDGKWIAYSSNESGRSEVWVRALSTLPAGIEGKWQISNGGGLAPGWSPNGRDLLYRIGDHIMAAGYTARGDSFVAEKPREWAANVANASGFDFTSNDRVAITVPLAAPGPPKPEHTVVLVQNFFDELRRLAPVGR